MSSTLSNVLGLSGVLAGTALLIQVMFAAMASSSALGAAQEGARVASLAEGSAVQGQAAAQSIIDRGVGVEQATVTATRTGTEATVNVQAKVVAPFSNLWSPTIRVSQSRPIERLTP